MLYDNPYISTPYTESLTEPRFRRPAVAEGVTGLVVEEDQLRRGGPGGLRDLLQVRGLPTVVDLHLWPRTLCSSIRFYKNGVQYKIRKSLPHVLIYCPSVSEY